VIRPHEGEPLLDPLFAGYHRLNGNGELTGIHWIEESGLLSSTIGLTNTHSVGVVRDALVADAVGQAPADAVLWSMPVVGETYDGGLNEINGQHVTAAHAHDALAAAAGGPVAEGSVGSGTGMVCHEFKGGIGTSSRVLAADDGGHTVGVLTQCNHGRRHRLRINGAAVGERLDAIPLPSYPTSQPPGTGSIIVVVATDAPLLPHQCARLAQRPALGLGRMGSYASHGSGDLFLAFATGNRGISDHAGEGDTRLVARVEMVADSQVDPLFEATAEATEESIVNALLAATTMTGRDGITAHALPHDRLRDVMTRYGRLEAHR
jgi:D-aminopeptidase